MKTILEKLCIKGFSSTLYYKTIASVQNGIQIIRCFKCQKFGHISTKYQSGEKCGHCSEDHLFRDCPNKNQESKCANCTQINGEVYLSTLPKQHDWPFLIKEAPGIANLSGLKIYLKKVRNSELSEKNSSTAPTTQMENDLIMRKMSLRAFYLRNFRSGCEKL